MPSPRNWPSRPGLSASLRAGCLLKLWRLRGVVFLGGRGGLGGLRLGGLGGLRLGDRGLGSLELRGGLLLGDLDLRGGALLSGADLGGDVGTRRVGGRRICG